jgi:asparagine synthase (glutamine-hydrolysing)
MCGIAGYFSNTGFFGDSIEKMTQRINHRGPNSQGVFKEKSVALGHRRLSILDLSDRANQPMMSHNGRFVMVYNGEIYNYREIAAQLKFTNPGINFNTSSDTETILELFALQGMQSIQSFNGMFAIAIYDRQQEELTLVRDRIGIKPFYYYWDGFNLAFASELKSLMESPAIKKEINPNAILKYFNLGFVPAPDSIYKNVYKLEPGACLRLKNQSLEVFKYWSVDSALSEDVFSNEKQALVLLSDLLSSSVQFQLRSDVPFGVFLSGGIDSSLITSLAVKFSGTKINTFSIGFEENKFDESRYAAAVAKHLGTNHHQFIVKFKDAFNLIEDIVNVYDEPFADSSAIPTMLVSKLAKQHVTVTLSGEGGDELFMGYGAYKWASRLDSFPFNTFRPFIGGAFAKMSTRFKRIAQLLDYDEYSFSHIFSQEQYLFSKPELRNLINEQTNKEGDWEELLKRKNANIFDLKKIGKRDLSMSELQAIFDIKTYLPDDLLTKVDRASMRYGLETRVPFLDHRVVEFALNLNKNFKIKNSVQKYLLKEILYQYIPSTYFDRPKQGFAIPLSKWINKDLRPLIDEYMNESLIKDQAIFNYAYIINLQKRLVEGEYYLYNRLWQILVFQMWYNNVHLKTP